ncbi:MAG: ribonuclease P protein component [Bacilli bacterium]|jgi:ribonuclease P protein component|nr:ribonuclease P protein component [Bacilli bacterium]MDD3841118.1 ribonuclease P protein component [Bacilli bacterium]HKM10046.1 ribonuclease P protein component [Bacilli bacterium]
MKVVNRIKANKQFALIIHGGRAKSNRSYVVHFAPTNLPYMRVGISVSSKVGNAVVRNRIKRQVRAMSDSMFDYNKASFDLVIIVKKNFLDNDYQTNKSLLSELVLVQIGKNE